MSGVRGYPVNLVTVHMNQLSSLYIIPSRLLVNYGPSIVKLVEENFLMPRAMQRKALSHAFFSRFKRLSQTAFTVRALM